MAEQRRRWKYEKDIFGKKHRKYFLENVFGVDVFDLKTFRALRVKLSREYLKFFQSLDKMYERGEVKEITKEATRVVHQTLGLLDSMIESGTIDMKEVDDLSLNVEFLNGLKEMLMEKAKGNAALSEKISSIEETAGVSPQDLNVTEKLIRRGARREAKKGKEGVFPFLKRTMPRTVSLASELGAGAGAALLGPFAPILKGLGGVGADILGFGKGIAQKVGEGRERKLQKTLSSKLGTGAADGRVAPSGGVSTGRRSSLVGGGGPSDLFNFFDKEAYKASWTEELLAAIKGEDTRKGGRGIFGGLVEKLGLAIVPFLGATGHLALLAAGFVGAIWALDKFKSLVQSIVDWWKSQTGLGEAGERASAAAGQRKDVIKKMGLGEFAERAGKSKKQVLREQAKLERSGEVAEALSLPWWKKAAMLTPVGAIATAVHTKKKVAEIPTVETRMEELGKEFQQSFSPSPTNPETKLANDFQESINKLNQAALGLSKATGKLNKSAGIGEPGIGNPWDTSDPGIKFIAGSEIDMDE